MPGSPKSIAERALVLLVGLGAGSLLLAGAATLAADRAADNITDNISVLPVEELAPAPALPETLPAALRYTAPAEPLNILFLGSDTRENQGAGFGTMEGFNGDTTMLLHVNAEHTKASILSIPRDLWTSLPECTSADGTTYQETEGKFNSALPRGGPDCVVKTVKKLTGIPIHHVVVIDFTGFAAMVDAVGGLRVCLNEPVEDPWAKASFPAGEQTIDGMQALSLARARKTIGDGSDTSRISRQQAVLMRLYEQVSQRGILGDPLGLYRLAEAAAKNLSTDPALAKASALVALAKQLRGIEPDNVRFLTVPWVDRGDGENVVLDRGRADPLFAALRDDTPLPSKGKKGGARGQSNGGKTEPATPAGICADPLW